MRKDKGSRGITQEAFLTQDLDKGEWSLPDNFYIFFISILFSILVM
jgi:hypothetical protein